MNEDGRQCAIHHACQNIAGIMHAEVNTAICNECRPTDERNDPIGFQWSHPKYEECGYAHVVRGMTAKKTKAPPTVGVTICSCDQMEQWLKRWIVTRSQALHHIFNTMRDGEVTKEDE